MRASPEERILDSHAGAEARWARRGAERKKTNQ